MGFTQCHKNNPTEDVIVPILEGETYNVTLTLGGSNNRSGVNPIDSQDIAPVTYEVGDVIYVAYNGAHCGTLECTVLSTTDTDQNGDKLGVFTGTHHDNPGRRPALVFLFPR